MDAYGVVLIASMIQRAQIAEGSLATLQWQTRTVLAGDFDVISLLRTGLTYQHEGNARCLHKVFAPHTLASSY